MRISKTHIIIGIMSLVIAALCLLLHNAHGQKERAYEEGYKDGTYVVVKADETIKQLKKENKELYDSIKSYKDNVKFVTQFKYKKVYVTDTVYVSKNDNDKVETFTYSNKNQNDSLNYNLSIGSITEPSWYKLDISVGDKFTIINKKTSDNNNQTIISSGNGGLIEDVTAFNKKEKKNIWNNFSTGPTIGVGYGTIGHSFDIYVGVGVTYKVW